MSNALGCFLGAAIAFLAAGTIMQFVPGLLVRVFAFSHVGMFS